MVINKGTIIIGAAVATSLISGACGLIAYIKAAKKIRKVSDRLNKSIDQLADDVDVEISDAIVRAAVDEAVSAQAEKQVNGAIQRACFDVERDMKSRIQQEVNGAYSDLKQKVKEEMERQVGALDIRDIRRSVVEDAKREAKEKFSDALKEIEKSSKEKFDSELDDILQRYNNQLKDVSRIYGSVASTLGAK